MSKIGYFDAELTRALEDDAVREALVVALLKLRAEFKLLDALGNTDPAPADDSGATPPAFDAAYSRMDKACREAMLAIYDHVEF